MTTTLQGHGDPLLIASVGRSLLATSLDDGNGNDDDISTHHEYSYQGDPLFDDALEYHAHFDDNVNDPHRPLHMEPAGGGHGDPLLTEFVKELDSYYMKDVPLNDETTTPVTTLPEFHFQGDPLLDAAIDQEEQKKKKAQYHHKNPQDGPHKKAEPGASPILGDHIWSLADVMPRPEITGHKHEKRE